MGARLRQAARRVFLIIARSRLLAPPPPDSREARTQRPQVLPKLQRRVLLESRIHVKPALHSFGGGAGLKWMTFASYGFGSIIAMSAFWRIRSKRMLLPSGDTSNDVTDGPGARSV